MKFEKISKLLPCLGLGLFLFIVSKVGIKRIVTEVVRSDKTLLGISVLLMGLITLIQSFKWQKILSNQGINISLSKIIPVWLGGLFYGMITPGRVGSFSRAVMLKKQTHEPVEKLAASVFIDRVIDTVCVIFLAVLGAAQVADRFAGTLPVMIIALLMVFVILVLVMNQKISYSLGRTIYKSVLPKRWKKRAKSTYEKFYMDMPSISKMAIPFSIGLFNWLVIYTQAFLVFRAVGVNVPYFEAITLLPIATAVGLIPVTVGGLGTRELTLIALFEPYSSSAQNIIAGSLLQMMIGYAQSATGAFFAWKWS